MFGVNNYFISFVTIHDDSPQQIRFANLYEASIHQSMDPVIRCVRQYRQSFCTLKADRICPMVYRRLEEVPPEAQRSSSASSVSAAILHDSAWEAPVCPHDEDQGHRWISQRWQHWYDLAPPKQQEAVGRFVNH